MSDESCDFLVVITTGTLKTPVFVRAPSLGDAHAQAVKKTPHLDGSPAYAIETFVITNGMLSDVIPGVDVKAIAKHYWTLGREAGEFFHVEDNDKEFEVAWREHGSHAWIEEDDGHDF